MRTDLASPQCFAEIYPAKIGLGSFAGPSDYQFSGGDILSCSVSKDITESSGTFSITLAPGGQKGISQGQGWAETIAPMSLILIGMQRAGRSNIVMVGVVTDISESTNWGGQGVQRITTISGYDMSYYFNTFNYFAAGALGAIAGTAIGEALNVGAVAAPQLLNSGYQNGTPQQIGLNFIKQVMFGKSFGLLQNTKVLYKQGTPIKLGDMFATVFEEYPESYVFFDTDYVTNEESWYAKFQNIFPFPWYEFFITTAPMNYYGKGQSFGYSFGMQSMKSENVQATIVARINPTPVLTVSTPTPGLRSTISGVDTSKWNALELFTPDDPSPRQWSMQFGIGPLANHFAVNPTSIGTMFGGGNALNATLLLSQESAIDTSSVIDFGYRPAILPTVWFGDREGYISQNSNILDNISNITAGLIARIASTFGPQNLMAGGNVVLPLRPDIMPGERFRFAPFKHESETWDFYIQGVQHNYGFGGDAITVLTLANGLPTTIYQSTSTSADQAAISNQNPKGGNSIAVGGGGPSLQDVLQGKAVRTAVGYDLDISRSGVEFFGPSSDINAILSQISSGFNNPGGTAPN